MQESEIRQWTVLLPSGPVGGEVGARCHQSHCWDSRVRECDQLYTITKRHYYSARICLCEKGKPQQQALAMLLSVMWKATLKETWEVNWGPPSPATLGSQAGAPFLE